MDHLNGGTEHRVERRTATVFVATAITLAAGLLAPSAGASARSAVARLAPPAERDLLQRVAAVDEEPAAWDQRPGDPVQGLRAGSWMTTVEDPDPHRELQPRREPLGHRKRCAASSRWTRVDAKTMPRSLSNRFHGNGVARSPIRRNSSPANRAVRASTGKAQMV